MSIILLPYVRFYGKVIHVHCSERVNMAIESLKNEKFLGFDMEWKPSFSTLDPYNPVSLLQVSGKNVVALFYLQKLGGMPKQLYQLLCDDSVLKIGCGMSEDFIRLHREFDINVNKQSWVDISELSSACDGLPPMGLRKICQVYLNMDLDKTMCTSDWSNNFLSPSQVLYAATDAWVVRHIFWSAWLKPTFMCCRFDWLLALDPTLSLNIIKIANQIGWRHVIPTFQHFVSQHPHWRHCTFV